MPVYRQSVRKLVINAVVQSVHSRAVRKATGGNHCEYSEAHVLQYTDQNLAQSNMVIITWSEKLDQTSAERVF